MKKVGSGNVRVIVVHQLILSVMSLAVISLVRAAVPMPHIQLPQGARQCVQPKSIMRHQHFNFILHQRDETMHRGIRTKRYSLANCVSCHVKKNAKQQYIPINEKGQFCNSCHQYTAVTIDCFECHATVPTKQTAGQ